MDLGRRAGSHPLFGTLVPSPCRHKDLRPVRRDFAWTAERGPQRRPAPGAAADRGGITAGMEPILEELTEDESLRLVAQAQIGRIGFTSRFGPVVLPVNFKVLDGSVVFRTEAGSPLGEDLRTGIAHADYKVAFEIDEINAAERTGWSVMIQGGAHYVDDERERAALQDAGIEPWAGGEREVFVRIKPTLISGRRVRRR